MPYLAMLNSWIRINCKTQSTVSCPKAYTVQRFHKNSSTRFHNDADRPNQTTEATVDCRPPTNMCLGSYDLDLVTSIRDLDLDVANCAPRMKFLVQGFHKLKSPERDRQTDATERITTPHLRVVKKCNRPNWQSSTASDWSALSRATHMALNL